MADITISIFPPVSPPASTEGGGYVFERSLTGTDGWTEIGEAAVGDTAFIATGLVLDTTYYFRARSFNENPASYGRSYSGYTSVISAIAAATSDLVYLNLSGEPYLSPAGEPYLAPAI